MFRDREDAARQLAVKLRQLTLQDPIVFAIPRGGVVIGASIADALAVDLDVVLARKLRAPYQPELAIGAVSEDGSVFLYKNASEIPGVSEAYLASEKETQLAEIERRRKAIRQVLPCASVAGRSAIVVDDGIATGSTMMAGLHVLRALKARELIVAVPVAPADTVDEFRRLCDRIICMHAPEEFWAIGQFYRDFSQVDDATMLSILATFARRHHLSPTADTSESRTEQPTP